MPVHAVLDWSAHLVTGALVLRAFGLPPDDEREVLVSSVALDADHLPIALAMVRGDDPPRPWPHTFATPLVLLAAGRRSAAVGVAGHLARDLFTGPGIAAAFPLVRRSVRLPVWAEAVALGALLSAAWRRAR